jgi:hypothetical protein
VLLLRGRHPRVWDRHARLLRAAMPEALSLLGEARSAEAVVEALVWAARMADIESAELTTTGADGRPRSVRPRADDEEVVLELCLGPELAARSLVRFRWRPESGSLSPECETLLQVLVDVAAARFTRLGSEHAPRPALEAPSSRPSLASARAAAELP